MRPSFWLVIALVGLGTQAMRIVPVLAHGRIKTPPVVDRLLRHVPAVALAALAIPGALYLKTGAAYDLAPVRIAAALIGLLVALKTRSMLATLAAGMAALWALQALL